jgi:guanosine-3',5'-bis(diphosphate) 3'-pyrophosphohydrolase
VVWKADEESPHPIRLEVVCVDKPGMLAAITKNIAAAGINITTAQVKNTDVNRRSSSLFELNVTSARQLNTLMHSIATIDGVLKVTRMGQHNGHRPA